MKKPEDIELARALRRKRFLKEVINVIDNNIGLLEDLLTKYIEFDPKGISDKLSKAYQIPPGKEKEVLRDFTRIQLMQQNIDPNLKKSLRLSCRVMDTGLCMSAR